MSSHNEVEMGKGAPIVWQPRGTKVRLPPGMRKIPRATSGMISSWGRDAMLRRAMKGGTYTPSAKQTRKLGKTEVEGLFEGSPITIRVEGEGVPAKEVGKEYVLMVSRSICTRVGGLLTRCLQQDRYTGHPRATSLYPYTLGRGAREMALLAKMRVSMKREVTPMLASVPNHAVWEKAASGKLRRDHLGRACGTWKPTFISEL